MACPQNLAELEVALHGLLDPRLPSRPFISDGSPFQCDIAIVGINPGSAQPFWPHWDALHGFDRAAWVRAYYQQPGATRNATRNRIERLVKALAPLRVVELNAFPYATRTEAQIQPAMRDPRILRLMLDVAQPKGLFLFGLEAARTVAPLLDMPVPLAGTTTRVACAGRTVTVFTERHLSRGWSYARVEAFAQAVRLQLAQPGDRPTA